MDVQTKANSVRSEAVASTIWPLISNGGHTGRAVETEMRDMHIAYCFLVPARDLAPRSQIYHDCHLRDCQPRRLRPKCTLRTFISKKLLRGVRCCRNSSREGAESNC